MKLDGDVVALLPENQQQVAGAVAELLRRSRPSSPRKGVPEFANAVKRCDSAAEMLASVDYAPDVAEQRELAGAVLRMRLAALRFGVIFDR